jgi:hypothetical protein
MFFLYLDPGSGSFLIQLLIAGLAGIGIIVGSQWAKIKRLIGKRKAEAKPKDDDDDEEE